MDAWVARALPCIVATAVALTVPPAVEAQYFGQNKVQHHDFDFRVLRTEHFDIYYYPREREAAEMAARMAERWRERLGTVFDHELRGRQSLILYASGPQFQQTNVVSGIGEGTGGVTEALRRRIVMPIGGTPQDLDHVLGHELVHAYQYDMTGTGGGVVGGQLPAASVLPLWFIEGMAEYLSIGPVDQHTTMWMRGAVRYKFPSFRDLEDPRFFPYRYGHAFLAYIAGRWSDDAIGYLLRSAARRQNVAAAIAEVLRMHPDTLVSQWQTATRETYAPLLETTREAEEYGPRIIAHEGGQGGSYNVSPALSPDGERLMFLSDRDLFSIDLFLADARTGEVKERVTETALDAHLQSLQFIQSAGSWHPDGRRFVLAGISGARPVLQIYDADETRMEREIKLPDLGEVLNPQWAPDGSAIVFSGVDGGLTDLFIYELEADTVRRLTNDLFADLQPAWSPDGGTIAWVTDRFTTSLDGLDLGKYTLALFDLATGQIRRLSPAGDVRHLNPQWAPDGESLFFLADRGGVTNIYRTTRSGDVITQVTDLYSGASGITETSPALSVASRSGRLVYSVFRDNGYDIHAIDSAHVLAGQPLQDLLPIDVATLPPTDRSSSQLAALLNNPTLGLPADTTFRVDPYRAGLGLTYVGQPTLIAGSNQYGTYVGGGAALYFSDLLGNRNLVTGLQVNGGIKDIYALVGYQNVGSRINWSIIGQQVPYLTGGFAQGISEINGQTVFVEQELLQRQTNRDILLGISYPFNRFQRLELNGGFTNISFDRELRTRAFSVTTGQQVFDDEEDLGAPDALNLGTGAAALVFDNSIFGATSPIAGQRYRFEAGGNFGSLDFVTALADFRRYFLVARPFTFAARLLHYGRYGADAEDPRIQPLFLGDPGLVRGYSWGSFDGFECNPPADNPNACPVFDQLLGSRLAVASAELRFPLLGVLGVGTGYYGGFPLELALFGDAGVAWDDENEPWFSNNGPREPVYSAGAALRANVLGFLIAEAALVRPFDRPAKNWVWQFTFQPGF